MLAVSRLVARGGPLPELLDGVAAEAAERRRRAQRQHPAAGRRRHVQARRRRRPERPLRRAARPRPGALSRPRAVRPRRPAPARRRDRRHGGRAGVRAMAHGGARRGLPRDGLAPAERRRRHRRRPQRLPRPARSVAAARARRARLLLRARRRRDPRGAGDRAPERARSARSPGSCAPCASRPTSTRTGCTPSADCWRSARRRTRCASSRRSRPSITAPTAACPRAIEQQVVAGLLLAEIAEAQRKGVALELEEGRLTALPPRLTEVDAVTILANLLQNAVDAVAGARRRAPARPADARDRRASRLTIRVADRGPGLPSAGPAARIHDQVRPCRGRAQPRRRRRGRRRRHARARDPRRCDIHRGDPVWLSGAR